MATEKYNVVIQRSKKRRKTIQATLKGDIVSILAPFSMNEEEVNKFANKFLKKLELKDIILNNDKELLARAKKLKKKFIPEASDFTILFQESLKRTWGKCFTNQRRIVINPVLGTYPKWVLDFVIIHELAHLLVPNHGKQFRELVDRYKLKERAVGFLMAKGMKEEAIDD